MKFLKIVLCFSFMLTLSDGFSPKCLECIRSGTCQPPSCFCCRSEMNMPFPVSETPQIVFFSFDDALTKMASRFYDRLFSKDNKNPNGCPVSMTMFISHQDTDYSQVKDFYNRGMEIAAHSVTHKHMNNENFMKEAREQKQNLARLAGISEDHIVGWRSPFLEPVGDLQPEALKRLGYMYDATLTYSKRRLNESSPTPFTLDFGWPFDCKVKPCPKRAHRGFWEVPVVSLIDYRHMYDCVYVDGCMNAPPNENAAFQFLMDNFNSYYQRERIPFGINMHSSWFHIDERLNAMERFIKELSKMDDVYIVSISKMIQWLKSPTPLSRMDTFMPWQCKESLAKIRSRTNALPFWKLDRFRSINKSSKMSLPTPPPPPPVFQDNRRQLGSQSHSRFNSHPVSRVSLQSSRTRVQNRQPSPPSSQHQQHIARQPMTHTRPAIHSPEALPPPPPPKSLSSNNHEFGLLQAPPAIQPVLIENERETYIAPLKRSDVKQRIEKVVTRENEMRKRTFSRTAMATSVPTSFSKPMARNTWQAAGGGDWYKKEQTQRNKVFAPQPKFEFSSPDANQRPSFNKKEKIQNKGIDFTTKPTPYDISTDIPTNLGVPLSEKIMSTFPSRTNIPVKGTSAKSSNSWLDEVLKQPLDNSKRLSNNVHKINTPSNVELWNPSSQRFEELSGNQNRATGSSSAQRSVVVNDMTQERKLKTIHVKLGNTAQIPNRDPQPHRNVVNNKSNFGSLDHNQRLGMHNVTYRGQKLSAPPHLFESLFDSLMKLIIHTKS